MALPEDSTNLNLIKVGRSGKIKVGGSDKKNEDAAAFKRLMAMMQEEAGPGGYLHGRGALDHDDVLYLKEQRAAEQDAERMRTHNEKRAFLAFKAAQSEVDVYQTNPVFVEPKARSGMRQHDLLKMRVEVKPKKPRLDSPVGRPDGGVGVTTSSRGTDASGGGGGEGREGGEGVGVGVGVGIPTSGGSGGADGSSLLGLAYDADSEEEEEAGEEKGEGREKCSESRAGGVETVNGSS